MKTSRGRVVSLGVHIVDILGRPVTHIPPGQGRQLLDEIRITVAGTAAGTSVDLAKLGAEVTAMGAIGDDLLADFLISVLGSYGIETRLLARKAGVQTSATMLPIRPNGGRTSTWTSSRRPTSCTSAGRTCSAGSPGSRSAACSSSPGAGA